MNERNTKKKKCKCWYTLLKKVRDNWPQFRLDIVLSKSLRNSKRRNKGNFTSKSNSNKINCVGMGGNIELNNIFLFNLSLRIIFRFRRIHKDFSLKVGPCAPPSLFYTRAWYNLGKWFGEGLVLLCALFTSLSLYHFHLSIPLYLSLSLSLPLSPSLSLSLPLYPSLSLSFPLFPSLPLSLSFSTSLSLSLLSLPPSLYLSFYLFFLLFSFSLSSLYHSLCRI